MQQRFVTKGHKLFTRLIITYMTGFSSSSSIFMVIYFYFRSFEQFFKVMFKNNLSSIPFDSKSRVLTLSEKNTERVMCMYSI